MIKQINREIGNQIKQKLLMSTNQDLLHKRHLLQDI